MTKKVAALRSGCLILGFSNKIVDLSMKWIVCCIDGTSSHEWRSAAKDNSHVHRFYRNFGISSKGSRWSKRYANGPQNATTGSDSTDIKASVHEFIKSRIRSFFLNDVKQARDHKNCKVVLIGHSRGAAIAIDIARELQNSSIQVYFMGLFDAVDRSVYIDGGNIVNVKHAYHALRGLKESRPTFGNTGLSGGKKKYFYTSHGGVGGDVVYDPAQVGITGDHSCTVTPRKKIKVAKIAGMQVATFSYESKSEVLKRVRRAIAESQRAYVWMVGNARIHGLPI